MTDLIQKKCVLCEDQVPLKEKEIKEYMVELKDGWDVLAGQKIKKLFKFEDFKEAMVFMNKVANLAENEGHHPDIAIHYNKVNIVIWTHAIGGLSENDFILAAKIDNI